MATLHHPTTTFRQRLSGYWVLVCVWLLAGCSSPPAVISVGDALRITATTPQRVAGVLVWHNDQRLSLVSAIALLPDAPAEVAAHTIPIDPGSTPSLRTLPWRDTGSVRYLPVIATLHTDAVSQRRTLTDITFDIGEYHLNRLPTDIIVRITGRFERRDEQEFLVARESTAQFITLQPTTLTEFFPSRSDMLIEGVAVQSVFLPLVIAPITTHP